MSGGCCAELGKRPVERVPCVTDARSDPRGLRHATVMTAVSGSVFAHAWWNKAIRGRRAQGLARDGGDKGTDHKY